MRIAGFMATWGFFMATALSERCGHSWTVSLEAGAADAGVLFVIVSVMVALGERYGASQD